MRSVIGSAVGLWILIAAGAARAQFVVDDFEQDGFVLEASNGDVGLFQSASTAYFDGFRSVYLQGFGEPASTLSSAPGDGDDALVLTTGGGAIMELTYGGGTPNADFSAFAAIEVVVTQAPPAGQLGVRFGNPSGNASASTAFDGPGIYRFELDDMTTTGGFDFTEVDRIYTSITAGDVQGQTFAISEIRIVPEADAGGAALGTLLGIAALTRRRAAA